VFISIHIDISLFIAADGPLSADRGAAAVAAGSFTKAVRGGHAVVI
jgi:hypothetical protein